MRTQEAPVVAVVDYGMGNRRSVLKALERVGAIATLTSEHSELLGAQGLVVPGVGAFPEAMRRLHELGLSGVISDRAREGIPVLGICLGMQLLFERSEELQETVGLGLIPGEVKRLEPHGLPIPHVGWSEVEFVAPSPLTNGLTCEGGAFYHVHSFAARPRNDDHVVGITEYGERFATIVGHGRVFGVQFHPEKSSANGLALLERFVALCRAGAATGQLAVAVEGETTRR